MQSTDTPTTSTSSNLEIQAQETSGKTVLVPPPGEQPDLSAPQDRSGELVIGDIGGQIPFNSLQIEKTISQLPEEHGRAVYWLYAHGRSHQMDMKTLAGKLLRDGKNSYDDNTLYSVFRGRYNGTLKNIVLAIEKYRKLFEERERVERPPFIETVLTKHLFQLCDAARRERRIFLVYGDGQTGKTTALEEYARLNNHGSTRYLRLPTAAPLRPTVNALAKVCQLSSYHNRQVVQQQIIESFATNNEQKLLIVDELQQITLQRNEANRLMVIEFLREIHDSAKCGMVICGTNEALQEVESGPNEKWLRQLRRRAYAKTVLKPWPSDEDCLAFARHFGLTIEVPRKQLEQLRAIAREEGLGKVIMQLQAAARVAATKGEVPTWEHFRQSIRIFAKMDYRNVKEDAN